ncbi:CorA metal ion transporter [Coemansia sp. IMI 203386]|nr:CorA metal ion transporter [Coemansia sp. IMI 203386]
MASAPRTEAAPSTARIANAYTGINKGASSTRIDFSALRQWSESGRVKNAQQTASNHRRYRLGRWHSRSTSCSWNPPSNSRIPSPPGGQASGLGNQSMQSLSVDINHKPSESRRSSIISSPSSAGFDVFGDDSDNDDGTNGPLAQMLLKENDEIWNNPKYRFTFYSPATGTVRSTDVRNLKTDSADGLAELMQQAAGVDELEDRSKRRIKKRTAEPPHNSTADVAEGDQEAPEPRPPQLSVTSVDSVPDIEQVPAAQRTPSDGFLHPNHALGQGLSAPSRHRPRGTHHRAPRPAHADNPLPMDDSEGQGTEREAPRLFWLDIMDPTDGEIRALSRIFDLHPLTIEELMLMRTPGLAQDSHKSFHHYDIVCYRTCTVYNPLSADSVSAGGGSTDGSEHNLVTDVSVAGSLRRRRSFVHADDLRRPASVKNDEDLVEKRAAEDSADAEIAEAVASWSTGDENDDTKSHAALDVSVEKKGRTSAASFRNRLGTLLARPQIEQPEVPVISIPRSHRNSYMPSISARADIPVSGDPPDDNLEEPISFYIIVLDTGVVTLHCGNMPHVRNTVARLMLDEEVLGLTPDYIAYLLLDDITDTLVPTTRLLELEVDAIDELVLILTRAEHDDVLKRIGIERRHALWLVRLLHGKAEVLRAIERRIHAKIGAASTAAGCGIGGNNNSSSSAYGRKIQFRRLRDLSTDSAPCNSSSSLSSSSSSSSSSVEDARAGDSRNMLDSQLLTSDEEEGDLYGWSRRATRAEHSRAGGTPNLLQTEVTKYLADVHDHLIALTASVHHCERILARAHGNYLARINLELTHASNTTNQLATQMTVLAGIFLPLNLVAGIFGMNVKVPGRDRDDLRDFGLILGAMAAFVVIALVVCRWRRII